MKALKIFIFYLLLLCTASVFAQKSCDHRGSGKSIAISPDKIIETWYQNVWFDAANIKIEGADSLRWDNNLKKLIAYNCKSYTFKGRTVKADPNNKLKEVHYTLGEAEVIVK